MDSIDARGLGACTCPACTGGLTGDRGELFGHLGFSLDPNAGGSYAGKPIYDLDQITANLNRTGYDWYTDNYGELDDGVLNFGFWNNIEELQNSYYVNIDGSIAFNEAFYAADFSTFTTGQRNLAINSIGLWDDLIDITFQQTKSGSADITFGNTYTGGAQAYAYLPFGSSIDDLYYDYYGFEEVGRLGGDVWIDGFVASNFNPLTDSYYATTTMIHELGHALGLSHPGDYNALDDSDGDGVPDPISYANSASFAQDSLQYSIMSYWDAYETGAQHIDWSLANFAYAATPLVHDIASIQAIYGADMTTRTGDTVYGFNSTADRTAYDFTVNTRPIVAIWDAGGIDTIDFSGWNTPSTIDLSEGAFSSGGGIEKFLTLEEVNANRAALGFAPRSATAWAFYEGLKAELGLTNGLFKDNVSIAYGVTIENAIGGGGKDTITGNAADNTLEGLGGDDTISGGVGNDTIRGGAGADILDGGEGFDKLSYSDATGSVTVNLSNNYTAGNIATKDKISNFEAVQGGDFNDTLTGSNGDNTIWGGGGNDTISSGNGNDTVFGEAGNDTVRGGNGNDILDGGAGIDNLLGEGGNDIIFGGADNDTLNGGNGNDTLNGEGGSNTLIGGAGNDIFAFTVLDGGKDIISDFKRGADKIDLRGLDANSLLDGNQAFSFIGNAAFSGAGQLRTFSDGGIFSLGGDVDGDGVADLVISLSGLSTITATDILFA